MSFKIELKKHKNIEHLIYQENTITLNMLVGTSYDGQIYLDSDMITENNQQQNMSNEEINNILINIYNYYVKDNNYPESMVSVKFIGYDIDFESMKDGILIYKESEKIMLIKEKFVDGNIKICPEMLTNWEKPYAGETITKNDVNRILKNIYTYYTINKHWPKNMIQLSLNK